MEGQHFVPVEDDGESLGEQADFAVGKPERTAGGVFCQGPAEDFRLLENLPGAFCVERWQKDLEHKMHSAHLLWHCM